MRANYEAIPSEDTTLLPSPLTRVGEEHRRSRSWVSSLRKAAAPLAAVALVLMGVSFIAKSLGLGCPHKMPMGLVGAVKRNKHKLRGGEVDMLGLGHSTESPTLSPTISPTVSPTLSPTVSPTISPTLSPVKGDDEGGGRDLHGDPTVSPTLSPTVSPTVSPTLSPV